MKAEFIQPRFEGERFAEHTLPIDVAADLRAYEELVVELAKRLYLRENPGRQRVPKGFDSDFQLHIEKVDEGSSRPLLSIVAAGTLLLPGTNGDYFERSRDLINECIAAPEGQLPEAFPSELLKYFNRFGRSLRSDEKVEFRTGDGAVATLTPDRRKHLVLAADREYEREVELNGTIEEADWQKSTFRLRQTDGSKVTVPMPDSFRDKVREIGGHRRHLVSVYAVGAFDEWDVLRKVVSTEIIDVQPNYELNARFDALREIEDSWLDGQGKAPNPARLEEVAARMIRQYPEHSALPAMVATPEGGLLLEWDNEMDPSLEFLPEEPRAVFHAFDRSGEDIEKTFDLTNDSGWGRLFRTVSYFAQEEEVS